MFTTEKNSFLPTGTTHRLRITNEQTGEVELDIQNVAGGIYIVHQTTDTELGTRQGAFGRRDAIVLSAMKAPSAVRDLLQQTRLLKIVRKLAEDVGLDLSI